MKNQCYTVAKEVGKINLKQENLLHLSPAPDTFTVSSGGTISAG